MNEYRLKVKEKPLSQIVCAFSWHNAITQKVSQKTQDQVMSLYGYMHKVIVMFTYVNN